MIVKMKFLSISGPKNDIDRVCEVYLSKYEMQLENAAAELKTTDNLQPFVEVNPYKEPLAKAEQFNALLSDEDQRIDASMNQDDMLSLIRDVNHDYLDLVEKKELTKKQVRGIQRKASDHGAVPDIGTGYAEITEVQIHESTFRPGGCELLQTSGEIFV